MNITATIIRLLSFRIKRDELMAFGRRHLLVGIIGTWLVGMGRYWDDDKASLVQHLGLGSVIYIFLLAGFIWLIVKPYRIADWNYFTVLTFISLTSFPAIFYAIPVERFVSIEKANSINVWFLAIVAAWRLALLYYFMFVYTRLSRADFLTLTLMPVCLIISALTFLNLHRVVFNIMGGVRNPTPHDDAYLGLLLLTVVSIILTPLLLLSYAYGIYTHRRNRKMIVNAADVVT